MNIEEVLKMWKEDSIIDDLKLDDTTVRMARVHSKYLELITISKMRRKKKDLDYKTLLKDKWLYYNGKMTQEQIAEYGWEFDPFNGLKVLKGEMDHYYDSDIDIQKSEEKIVYWKTIVETLEEIVTSLNWRHQTIGNMIRWRMFEAGS
mgnify:CR=1 FL=1